MDECTTRHISYFVCHDLYHTQNVCSKNKHVCRCWRDCILEFCCMRTNDDLLCKENREKIEQKEE